MEWIGTEDEIEGYSHKSIEILAMLILEMN